jgi:hypothetical protein
MHAEQTGRAAQFFGQRRRRRPVLSSPWDLAHLHALFAGPKDLIFDFLHLINMASKSGNSSHFSRIKINGQFHRQL